MVNRAIRTTQTAVDRMAKLRRLNDEIVKAKQEKEIVERELRDFSQTLTVLRDEYKDVTDLTKEKDEFLSKVNEKTRNEVEEKRKDLSLLKKQENSLKDSIGKSEIKLEKIDLSIKEKTKLFEDFKNEIKTTTADLDKIKQSIEQERNKANLEKQQFTLLLAEWEQKLKEIREEYNEKREFILKEEVRLARKNRDLMVYEQRLRKRYKEINPEVELIL